MSGNWQYAYLCATQGHLITGSGWGTSEGQTVWSNYCARCGAKVEPPRVSVEEAKP